MGATSPARRRRVQTVVPWFVGATALLATALTFLGWGRSGTRMRSSYELVDVAERAGVLPDHFAALAPAWFLVPALCGLVLVALGFDQRMTLGIGSTTLGVLVGTGAVLVMRSPLVTGPATIGGLLLGCCTAAGGVVVLSSGRQGWTGNRNGSKDPNTSHS